MSNIEGGTFEQTVCKHTLTQISSNNSLKSCSIPRTAPAAILGAEEPKGPMGRWGHLNFGHFENKWSANTHSHKFLAITV